MNLLLGLNVSAQDIHFSQFYMNPIFLNPALAGNFNGDWRFSANQRQQWRSVSRPYNTVAISAENKEGWILPGMYHGINFFHDAAGDGNYKTIEMSLSTAYQMYLDNDSIHSITPGFQFGINHRNIDYDNFKYDSQYNGLSFDASLPSMETFPNPKRTGLLLNLGLMYAYRPEKRKEIVAGLGWYNIPQNKQSFFGNDLIKRDRRFAFHSKAVWELNFEWDLQPGIFLQFQGKYKEIIFGSNLRYIFKDKKGEYIAPYGGIWWRNRDAAYLVAGMYYNNWIAGISYDLNFSKLVPASNLRGGLELSVQYVLHLFKPKDIIHRICPDYL